MQSFLTTTLQDIGLLFIGVSGLVAHWAKQYFREQTTATLHDYFLVNERKATWNTLVTFGASFFAFLSSAPEFSMATAYAAFSVGYVINSALNAG